LGCVSHITTTTSKEVSEMNSVNITGRLTADPELRALPSGENVCKLRLAVEGMSPGGETGYVNVAAFGKPGEAAARVLAKGWLVAVAGRLSYRAWEADDGSKRHDYEVVGNVEFLAAPRGNSSEGLAPRKIAVS
jgi:single-strand DNA-binding protein